MRATPYSRLRVLRHTLAVAALVVCFIFPGSVSAEEESSKYIVLCYHSIPERYQGDPMSISAARFVEQLEWLREQGYIAIDLDQILAAKAGKTKLPAKSFLITFDDGYEDFYTNVFPLLKLYKVPAVMALVGKWTEDGIPSKNGADPYFSKQRFLSWAQIKEMITSGLIEIASHSYDLHHGVLGNPQGNTQPAAVTLQYDSALNQYETLDQRRTRLRADLEKNSRMLEAQLGKRPRIMVWPYGAYDRIGIEESARAGLSINFTLDAGRATVEKTEMIPRVLVDKEMPLSTFSYFIEHAFLQRNTNPVHAIKVHLDRLYDKDPDRQNNNLGILLERIRTLGLNTVVLQPFATPGSSGLIEEVYFPNSMLPMRADLLNRVAWQFRSRLGVTVYILVPVSYLSLSENGKPRPLDPAIEPDRQHLFKFYEELRSHIPTHGIIFTGAHFASTESGIMQDFHKLILPFFYFPEGEENRHLPTIHLQTTYGWTLQTAEQRHPFAVMDIPPNLHSDDIKKFIQNLPSDYGTWLSLPVSDLNEDRLSVLLQKIRLLQAYGIHHFILDDDSFLDDPSKVNALRSVLSLKSNPYVEVGQ